MALIVRATKGKTTIHMPCPGQAPTEITVGSIHKVHKRITPGDEALTCQKTLIAFGWKNVEILGKEDA